MTSRPYAVYFFTFVLAFCSLFYELVYAQILSVCLGGTKVQYLLIISIFTCALGFGSIAQGRIRLNYPLKKVFFCVEVFLTILGAAGPFLITWMLQPNPSPALATTTVILSYFIVSVIGFLSGFEIPCLFAMLENSQGKILAFDYIGMLAASVSFPLFFLPYLGTASSALLVACFNALALIWLVSEKSGWKLNLVLASVWIFSLLMILRERVHLDEILSSLYLGGL